MPAKRLTPRPKCSVPGCREEQRQRGWCTAHYMRWWRRGDPESMGNRGWRLGRHIVRPLTDIIRVTASGCWEWLLTGPKRGYGRVVHRRRVIGAHRAMFAAFYGPIPQGLSVLHHCDNPPCVRPDHLWLGTAKDNQADAVAKRRHSGFARARITEQQVLEIRASALPTKTLADAYRCSTRHIRDLVTGKKRPCAG